MPSQSKRNSILTCVAVIAGLLSTLLRVLSILFFYDTIPGYYVSGAVLPIISNVFFALCTFSFVLYSALLTKNIDMVHMPNKAVRYVALVPATTLLVHVAFAVSKLVKELPLGTVTSYDVITLVATAASVVFFISLAFSKQPSATTVLCGLGFIVWIALLWIRSYTNFYVPMNSPDKIFFHLACIGAALFTVEELRTIYAISRPKLYYFSLWYSILSLASYAIPTIAGILCNMLSTSSVGYESAVFFSLLVYIAVRAFSLLSAPRSDEFPHNDDDTADVITESKDTI